MTCYDDMSIILITSLQQFEWPLKITQANQRPSDSIENTSDRLWRLKHSYRTIWNSSETVSLLAKKRDAFISNPMFIQC